MANLLSWLGNKAKEVAAGVERQVNPFDGGATYSNPRPPQQQQKIQAQRQQAQNLINRATQIQQQVNNVARNPLGFAGGQAYNIAKSITPIQVRDVFDANTASDQAKRLAEGEARMYYDQQKAKGVARPQQNIGQAIAGNTARLANTGLAGIEGVAGLGKVGVISALGNDKQYKNAVAELNRTMDKSYNPTGGILGAGTVFKNRQEAGSGNVADQTKRFIGSGLGTATEILPMTRGYGAVNKAIQTAGSLPKVALANSLENAGYGFAGSIAQQLGDNGKIDPLKVAQDTAVGAGMGLAVPVGGVALKKVLGAGGEVIEKAAGIRTKTPGIDQPRNAGKYANKPIVPGADIKKTGGTQRLLNQAEFEHYSRTGNIPANADGKVNVIKPGQIDDVRGITPDRTYLVTLRDGLPIDSQAGPQAAIKGQINRKFVESIDPYVPPTTAEALMQAEKASQPKRSWIPDEGGYVGLPKTKEAPVPKKVSIEPVADTKAPQAPITTQATPDEIRISTAAINNKQGIKAGAQEVREQFVNRFAPVEDLVSKIERETGTPLRPSKNPLSYVRQYLGGGGIANDKIDNALTPIIKQTKEFDGLRQYLVARRMNELADRGMSKRADNVLADLSAKYGDEIGNFDKIAKELYEYQGKQLDELVNVGVLSRQAADDIRAKNQFYVPFNRVIPDLENFAGGGGQAIGKNGNPIKAIKGSDKEIIDPIESMIRNTYDIQATVQKQKVMRSLYELAPDEFTVPPKGSMNKNRVGMFINGEKVAFETSEPLSRALNNMAEEQLNLAVRVMSLPAKTLRSGATSLNVAFALPNIVRDQLSAAVNSKYGGIPVYDFVSGLASVMKKDDVYKNWIRSGADQASFFAQDRTTLQRGVKDITGGAGYKVGKLVKSPLELFRILGEVSEKGSRVGVYKRAEKGALKEFGNADDALLAAAKESREATIDFARRGSKMKAANSLIPFLNARLQGTLKLANSFKERPVQTASMGMAIAGLPAAALYLHNSEDPAYAEIPDYIKRENFIIMTGSKDTPFIKIPKGEVGKIFGNPVESFLAQLKSEDPSWKSTAQSLVDSFLPVGSVSDPAKFVTDLMPTAASVPMQMLANFDTFRGMPIVSQYQKDLPPEQQFSNYNTETGKKIGAALGVSPAMLEFGIGGLTGGLGRQALQIADLAQGNKIPTQDLPVISRFAGEQKDLNKSANEVYDQLEKDKQATARENYKIKQALKDGDTSALSGLDSAKAKQLQRSVTEDQIKKDLTPTEKALWGMSKEDLENYSGKYGSAASKVLDLKNSISTSRSTNPKDKYKQALDAYNQGRKNGTISDVQDMKQQSTLTRLKAQSESSQDAVDLYSLSFKNMVSFVNSNKNGAKLWEEVKALDKRMTDAGYTSKLYNKNGSLKATVGKSGKKSAKAKKGKVVKLPKFNITGKAVSYKKVGAPKAKLPVSKLPKIKINKMVA